MSKRELQALLRDQLEYALAALPEEGRSYRDFVRQIVGGKWKAIAVAVELAQHLVEAYESNGRLHLCVDDNDRFIVYRGSGHS